MKTSLLRPAGALAVLFFTAGIASAQPPLTGYWDGPQNIPPGPAGYYGGANSGYRSPFSIVADPAPQPQLDVNGKGPVSDSVLQNGPMLSDKGADKGYNGSGGSLGCGQGSGCGLGSFCGLGSGGGQWQVGFDLLYLTRLAGNSYPLLKVPQPTGSPDWPPTALDVADFGFSWELGYRINASRIACDGWGLDVVYFTLDDSWNYSTIQTGILELQGPGWTLGSDPDAIQPVPVSFHIWDQTRLYSVEMNVTRGLCDLATFRAGVRYIRLTDEIFVDELTTPLYGLLIANTSNELIGPQIGGELKLLDCWCSRLRVNAGFNCGVFYNRVKHDPFSMFFGPPLNSTANEVALLGEASLTAKVRVTEHIAIRGGYQILALGNVALAPDQIASSDVVTESTYTKMGSFVAHGATLGVEVFC